MDEHQLNDLLECSVCLDRLDTSSKVLPCQHTFCRKCLEVIVSSRQELRCPECRILVDIKIDELPPNVLLMRILEGMKNAAAAKTQQQQQHHHHHNDSNKLEEAQKLNQEQQQQIKLKQHQHQQQQQKQMLQYQQQQLFKQKQQSALQQQQQQQHAPLTSQAPPTTINNPASVSSNVSSAQAAQRRLLLPHAYALYDFDSSEPTDLHFKKGDLVLLRRKIDINWYVGQLNGVEGTFPINYVQVIIPLPAPHAIAMYDFKMGPNEEEGCLTFKKGTPIHVLRRVDHNWAEGRIGTNIGIFPIAFVELNALAKQLLDSFLLQNSATATVPTATTTQQQPKQQHQKPSQQNPTHPPANTTNTTIPQQSQSQSQPAPPRNLPPIPLIDPTTNLNPSDSNTSSSNSSSNTTSPHSTTATCSSSISSNSIPSSPNQSQTNTPQHVATTNTAAVAVVSATTSAAAATVSGSVRYRDCKEKRHSLNALLSAGVGVSGGAVTPALSILQSNRHSAEILSMPSELSACVAAAAISPQHQQQNARQRSGVADVSIGAVAPSVVSTAGAAPQSTVAREQQQTQTPPAAARINVLKSCGGSQNVPPTLPWGYLALYPYKPRKGDELELKKGCVYIVTERCLDGWFKGKNWQDTSGVFPGNYVTPLRQRDHQQLMHQWKFVPQQQHQHQQSIPQQQQSSSNANTTTSPKVTVVGGSCSAGGGVVIPGLPHQPPPDLPPRQITTAGSVWTKPLGHTVEAFFNRCSNKTPPTSTPQNNDAKDSKEKESPNSTTTTPSTSSSSSSSSAAVSLMKRLTHMKSRSKSPGSAVVAANNLNVSQTPPLQSSLTNYSMDNPTFEDAHFNTSSNNATHAQLHPVHVRSGSCPSQLLQSLPMDLTALQLNENIVSHQQQHQQPQQQHKQQVSPQATYGSQRIKGSKERPLLQNVRQSMDGTFRAGGIYPNTASPPPTQQHQQQQQQPSTANTKCAQQQQQILTNLIHHRKSQSLDANTITAAAAPPPPPTVSTTTATTVTPLIAAAAPVPPTNTTAPCNITAAAIAASATTKSTQNTRESRFRCVVPYPPNSDIELELHVGDLIYVHRKQKNGWYKGTHARTNKTGLFPASFVEPDI